MTVISVKKHIIKHSFGTILLLNRKKSHTDLKINRLKCSQDKYPFLGIMKGNRKKYIMLYIKNTVAKNAHYFLQEIQIRYDPRQNSVS